MGWWLRIPCARRLDGEAVHAVLKAAGHRVWRRAGLPSGMTAREAEVLVRPGPTRDRGRPARQPQDDLL
jgi:hypothetical protein